MTEQSKNPMIEKLRKLIAHERSARSIGNMQEAEAFASRVQDLLTAHKLSMSEVDFQEREEGEPIDWERVDGRDIEGSSMKTRTYWRVTIANAIAGVNSCMIVNASGSRGTSFFFVGRTSDRQLAKILYVYLVELGEELCLKAAKENKPEQRDVFTARWRNTVKENFGEDSVFMPEPTWAEKGFRKWMKDYRESWKTGFGDAIAKRLKERYEETLKAQAQVSLNAIVHIKRDALAVREYLKGKTKKGRGILTGNNANQEGYAAGQSTGNAVNLSPHTFADATGRASRLLGS